ncbi:head-tail connector protein [Macrococcus carouselicus]|uniref:Phage gp6-like head-tail connector protein n=1 Tax=Macrococcus carouselicus TaxID=69969 RepID=A0A9Q8CMD2_9STAP|nr:head-tail connector protein [Macrococcus carouselicus]TDM04063.1 phage gp6-like head-tail connector protein [Macrococcus carouselicus]
MNLDTIKKHMKVTFDFDDEIINEYLKWAEAEIKDSVSTDPKRDESFFYDNSIYDRAVVLLVTHFYENRKAITDKPQFNLIYGVKSAVLKLRLAYQREMNTNEV